MNEKQDFNVLKECIDFIQGSKRDLIDGDTPYTEGDKEVSFDITEDRIFQIPDCDDIRKLGFVDGGTASILSAADFNISLNRIAGVLFEDNKPKNLKKTPEVIEFYSATLLEPLSDGKMAYTTHLFPRELRFKE